MTSAVPGRAHRSPDRRIARGAASIVMLGAVGAASAAAVVLVHDQLDHRDAGVPVLSAGAAVDGTPPSTLPVDTVSAGSASPLELRVASLDLEELIRPVGIASNGELEIPDETEVGWYELGSAPGSPGATVLAAHVSWNRTLGPFHALGDVEIGATIDLVSGGGAVRTYQVVERAMYDKETLPRQRIWRTTGDETLVLITCGGDFDGDRRRYRQNIVVYALPVAGASAPAG